MFAEIELKAPGASAPTTKWSPAELAAVTYAIDVKGTNSAGKLMHSGCPKALAIESNMRTTKRFRLDMSIVLYITEAVAALDEGAESERFAAGRTEEGGGR